MRALLIGAIVLLGACPRTITDSGYTLTVSPAAANLFVEDSARFTATLRDHNGTAVSAPFAWSTDNAAVASVDSTGLVRATGSGSAVLQVAARGEVATAALVVVVDSGQTLSITPDAANLFVASTVRFTATLKNRRGDTLAASPTWASSDTDVATVDATGLVRGVAPGSATIRATARGLVAAATITVATPPPSAVLVGAGDIASCTSSGDEATATLLDGIEGTVFTAGDNAYNNGSAAEFENCYGPSWGRHKGRTRPAIGNHEYNTPGASGYFDYFGAAAGEPGKGFYSYDLGAWHIIVLNSSLDLRVGEPQDVWLREDLANRQTRCTLAIWHHPRFSSGRHGSSAALQPLWQVLYDAGADVVISGHDHTYERFAPQTPDGQVDLARGIREFVVGTGGAGLYAFEHPAPNSEVKSNSARGVLKLTLYGDRYDWKFVPVAGGSFTDSGSARCH